MSWSGWTKVSEDRFIAERGQIGVVEGRVFKTKVDAESYYGPLKAWESIVSIEIAAAESRTKETP
jgi:hypothetical protein